MRGDNPIRGLNKSDGSVLEVKEIFPTIQTEGPLAGTPAVFVRLGGCNLACDFCDTEFENFVKMPLADVLAQVRACVGDNKGKRIRNLVVVTGGEPLRQPIEKLCTTLVAEKFEVQVETNGTLWRELLPEVMVVCSPKNTGAGYAVLREDVLRRASALKFIVSRTHPHYQGVADVGQTRFNTPVYVQPMDEMNTQKNEANTQHAKELALAGGYGLSLQMHKLMGLP